MILKFQKILFLKPILFLLGTFCVVMKKIWIHGYTFDHKIQSTLGIRSLEDCETFQSLREFQNMIKELEEKLSLS